MRKPATGFCTSVSVTVLEAGAVQPKELVIVTEYTPGCDALNVAPVAPVIGLLLSDH